MKYLFPVINVAYLLSKAVVIGVMFNIVYVAIGLSWLPYVGAWTVLAELPALGAALWVCYELWVGKVMGPIKVTNLSSDTSP